jgi:hypothetical protein
MHGLTWRGLETEWMTGLRGTLDPKGEKRPGLTWSVLLLRQSSTLLMRGHQRQSDGWLERDTRLKREKRYLLTSPGHYCAGVLLYKSGAAFRRLSSTTWSSGRV